MPSVLMFLKVGHMEPDERKHGAVSGDHVPLSGLLVLASLSGNACQVNWALWRQRDSSLSDTSGWKC